MPQTSPNTPHYQQQADLLHEQNKTSGVHLTGVAATTTQLTTQQLIATVTPPASGVQTYTLPTLGSWKNEFLHHKQLVAAPGGEIKYVYAEGGADVVGDNISAINDFVFAQNLLGEHVAVIREVTT